MKVMPEIETMPENLLRAPLDFLFADHFRQMLVCNFLDALAAESLAGTSARMAMMARDYLTQELPLHIADVEEDLLPCLRRLTPPTDRLVDLFALLAEEHRQDLRLAAPLLQGLDQLAQGRAPAPAFAPAAAAFTATQRRHIAWENSVLLPQARRRLAPSDLEALGRAMAARRSVEYPS